MKQDSLPPIQLDHHAVASVSEPIQFELPGAHDCFFENIMEGFAQLAVELEKHHCPVGAIDFPNAPTVKQVSEQVCGLSLHGNIRLLASEDRFGVLISTENKTIIGNWPDVFVVVPESLRSVNKICVDGKDYAFGQFSACTFTVLDSRDPHAWTTKEGMSIVTLMRGLGSMLVHQPEVHELTRFTGFTLTRNPSLPMQEPMDSAPNVKLQCDKLPTTLQTPVAIEPDVKPERSGSLLSIGFLKKLFS